MLKFISVFLIIMQLYTNYKRNNYVTLILLELSTQIFTLFIICYSVNNKCHLLYLIRVVIWSLITIHLLILLNFNFISVFFSVTEKFLLSSSEWVHMFYFLLLNILFLIAWDFKLTCYWFLFSLREIFLLQFSFNYLYIFFFFLLLLTL